MDITPPGSAGRWETSDLDELRARFSPTGHHRRTALGRDAFHFRLAAVDWGCAAAGWGECSVGQKIEAVSNVPLLHLPLTTPLSYRAGGRHLEAGNGKAVFLAPGVAYEVAYRPGKWVGFQLDGELLARTMQALLAGSPGTDVAPSLELSLLPGERLALARILRGGDAEPYAGTHAGRQVTDWLAGMLVARTARGQPARLAADRLRRIEEWIDGHLAEHIGLAQLCAVAGIDSRGLQKNFLRRRGATPLTWVRERRMAAARLRLLEARAGDTVTSVAFQSGFTQLGRFAIAYRRRYGESPSETLASARSA